MAHSISPAYTEGYAAYSRVSLSSMNSEGSSFPLFGSIVNLSSLVVDSHHAQGYKWVSYLGYLSNYFSWYFFLHASWVSKLMFERIIYQTSPGALVSDENPLVKSKARRWSLERLYRMIIRCMVCVGVSFPKSISSMEKQTLLPIDETDDRCCGYSLLAPLPSLSGFLSGIFE